MSLSEVVPIMVLGNILRQNGGVTHAVYRRANALSETHRYVVIATTGFQLDFWELVEWHKSVGNLRSNIVVWNMYEPATDPLIQSIQHGKNTDWTYFQDRSRSNARRVFDERGRYIRYEELRADGSLSFVDHFEAPWRRVKKSFYDKGGNVRLEKYMNADNVPSFQVVFDLNGCPLVSSRLGSDGRPASYFSHRNGIEYSDEMDMVADWLEVELRRFGKPVLFVEKREHVKQIASVEHPGVRRIFVLHSSHLDAPFDNRNLVSESMSDAFDQISRGAIDRMVVLTPEQKSDLKVVPSVFEKAVAIPHYQESLGLHSVERESNLIVSLARYHHAKNLDASIEIFSELFSRNPELIYEIYGYGPERDRLQRVIDDRGLHGKVMLCGHTDDPGIQLARARVSILTSRHEGFGLAVSESLAAGTPVVSFDTKYGPGSIIQHGKSGFLVDSAGGVSQAVDYVERIVQDDELWSSMHYAAMSVSDRFSKDRFVGDWNELLGSLE